MQPEPGTRRGKRRWIFALIGVGVSVLFLWLALRDTEFAEIGRVLSSANGRWALPFLLFLFLFYWLKSWRWTDLLSPSKPLRTAELFPAVMIGYAATAILPMQMGELVRTYIVSREHEIPYARVLGSIAIERVFDLLSVLALLGLIFVMGQGVPPVMRTAGYLVAAGCGVALLATALLVTRTDGVIAVLQRLLCWLPAALLQKIGLQLRELANGFSVLREPAILIRVGINSLVQWLLMGGCILVSLWAFDIEVPLSAAAMVLAATIIGISLPTSPGYIGNIQLAFALALTPYGVSKEGALAASLFYHALAYVTVVLVGFGFFQRYGFGFREIRRVSTDTHGA